MTECRVRSALRRVVWLVVVGSLSLSPSNAAEQIEPSGLIQSMLLEFREDASRPFSAEAGRRTWYMEHDQRSCTSCHTESLTTRGRHQKTGKVIEPMAPSVNPERLTERKKINKWFLRNCKWTYGRECTAQEKGDILLWLSGQ